MEAQHHHAQPWACPRPCTPGMESRSWGTTQGCARELTELVWDLIHSTGALISSLVSSVFYSLLIDWIVPNQSPGHPGVPALAVSPCSSLSLLSRELRPPRAAKGLGRICPAEGIFCPGDEWRTKTKPQAQLKTIFPSSREKEKIKKGVGNAMPKREDLKKTSHNVTRFLCGRNEHWQNSRLKGI